MQVNSATTVGVILGVSLYATLAAGRRFAYERGNCDISIASVLKEVFKNEVRALLNPEIRLPSSKKRLQFDLFTPQNPYERQVLRLGDEHALQHSYFNAAWPVRFSIHGWTGKSTSCSNAAIKDAYLKRGNFNVIIVDWSTYSLDISYPRLSKQLAAIAATVAAFVRFLNMQTGVPIAQMHLIGHSAGAHISGLAGKLLRPPQQLGAIIALDPAGLTQRRLPPTQRLAPTDALYVESVHSDITLLGNPSTALSQVSFFANWGRGQPQCPNATAAEFDFTCDHFAALYYFVESVRWPNLFGAIRCTDNPASLSMTATNEAANADHLVCRCSANAAATTCAADEFMGGEPAVPKRNGVYYFSTAPRHPYGLGATVQIRPPTSPNFLRRASSVSRSSYLPERHRTL